MLPSTSELHANYCKLSMSQNCILQLQVQLIIDKIRVLALNLQALQVLLQDSKLFDSLLDSVAS